jgi:serine/threonine protein kinase/Tfp pilus assembly protein PilF
VNPRIARESFLIEKHVERAREKTIVLIAAGGDASRFLAPLLKDRLRTDHRNPPVVPRWVRDYSLPTLNAPGARISFLGSHLTFLHNHLGAASPIAVVTGPNTHDAITTHLEKHRHFGLTNVGIIEQEGASVITTEGNLVFWEDGNDLRAPEGLGGMLFDLTRSDWMHKQEAAGYKYLYLWYVNDLTAGRHLDEHIHHFIAQGTTWLWASHADALQLVEDINDSDEPRRRGPLIAALEDCPGAYIMNLDDLGALPRLVDAHCVERPLPLLTATGTLARGWKREFFLSDAVWKRQHSSALSPEDASSPSHGDSANAPKPQTRARLWRDQTTFENVQEALKAGRFLEVPRDLHSKEVGDELVDRWMIERVIDKGGWSTVYVCQKEDRRVAVKTYKENDRWMRPGVRARFAREAHAWLALQPHPNVIEGLHIRELDGALHIFLEYAAGGDVRDLLAKGRVAESTALHIGIQVCDALQHLHNANILHKDVKPENILLDANNHVKVTDLGLAAAFYGDDLSDCEGTAFYIAPELVNHGTITQAADVYSLGATLYELLCGVVPFVGTKSDILQQHQKIDVIPLRERHLEIDAGVAAIVQQCLAKDPKARPSSASALGTVLMERYEHIVGTAFPATPTHAPSSEDEVRIGRTRSWGLSALGRLEEAINVCTTLRKKFPDDENVLGDYAFLLYDKQEFAACAAMCVTLLGPTVATSSTTAYACRNLMDMCAVRLGKKADIVEAHIRWLRMAIKTATVDGDNRRALCLADIAVTIDPQCFGAWLLKGQLSYERSDYPEAAKCLRVALKSWHPEEGRRALDNLEKTEVLQFPELLEHWTGLREAVMKADIPRIEACARRILELQPGCIWAMNPLGTALEQQGKYAEARSWLERAIAGAPADALAHYNLGIAIVKGTKDYRAALKQFTSAVTLDSSYYRALNMKAECHRKLGELEEAIAGFRKALEIEPTSSIAVMGLATALGENGEWDAATDYAQRAVELHPESAEAILVRDRTAQDRQVAERALEAIQERVLAAIATDDPTSAQKLLQEALAAQPDNAELQALLGSVCYRCGAIPAAVEHLSLAVRLDPDKPEYHIARGIALDHLGKHDDALADFNTAIALDPTSSLAYYERGVTQKYCKAYDAALEDFRRSIALNDMDHQAYVGAAEALAHQGKWHDALDYATRAPQRGSKTVAVLIKDLQQRLDTAELKGDSDPSRPVKGIHQFLQWMGFARAPQRASATAASLHPPGHSAFWNQLSELCHAHIRNSVERLKAGNWPHMAWAEERFIRLRDAILVSAVIEEAARSIASSTTPSIAPRLVSVTDNWYIIVSVHPSARDEDFLASCPARSVEELARQTREQFRQTPSWQTLDLAHWMLLVDEDRNDASIHLLATWNFAQCRAWASNPAARRTGRLDMAPLILPVDLMRMSPTAFVRALYNEDEQADALQQQTE